MKNSVILEKLIVTLPKVTQYHSSQGELYSLLKLVAKNEVESLFGESAQKTAQDFLPFGNLVFPYQKMGAIDSVDLFGLDELIIFSFYWTNRKRYKRTLDIGANIGLHSILMSKCGYDVECYEPDPFHYELLQRNINLNHATSVRPNNAAVSTQEGTANFIRVLGNTTGSHLAGAKSQPYGELETFPVKVVEFKTLLSRADLVKMDVEGHEKDILLSTQYKDWKNVDLLVEIGTPENAQAVYNHFSAEGVSLFAQKIGWDRVTQLNQVPTHYKEGTLFITCKNKMPWSE